MYHFIQKLLNIDKYSNFHKINTLTKKTNYFFCTKSRYLEHVKKIQFIIKLKKASENVICISY